MKFTRLLLIAALNMSVGMAAQGGTVMGWVVDRLTRRPIAGAMVSVDSFGLRTTTDSQAFFSLIHVPAGYRTIRASAAGHLSYVKRGAAVVDGVTLKVGFSLRGYDESRPQDTAEYEILKHDVAPPPETLRTGWSGELCTVDGKLVDSAGRHPIVGWVEVEGTELGATTDENGAYHIHGVPCGSWTLTAGAVGFRFRSVTRVVVGGDRKDSLNFALVPRSPEPDTVESFTTFNEKRHSPWVAPVEWVREFPGQGLARGLAVLQTRDMGYLAVGQTRTSSYRESGVFSSYGPTYIVKTGPKGELQWEKTLDSGLVGEAFDVRQTSDGGYMMSSSGFRGERVTRITDTGALVWKRNYPASVDFQLSSAALTLDDGFVLKGGDSIAKYDSAGKQEWVVLDSCGTGASRPLDTQILQMGDGSYLVQVCSLRYLRLDHEGNRTARLELRGERPAIGVSVIRENSGGYVIAGVTADTVSDKPGIFFARVDSQFSLRQKNTISDAQTVHGECLVETGLGGYLIVGETNSRRDSRGNAKVIRVDAQGDVVSVMTVNRPSDARCIRQTIDGGYIVVGTILDSGKGRLYLMKIGHERRELPRQ